jgi:hypothetical protein
MPPIPSDYKIQGVNYYSFPSQFFVDFRLIAQPLTKSMSLRRDWCFPRMSWITVRWSSAKSLGIPIISLVYVYHRSIKFFRCNAWVFTYVLFAWLKSHDWKYCSMICCERSTVRWFVVRGKHCSLPEKVRLMRQARYIMKEVVSPWLSKEVPTSFIIIFFFSNIAPQIKLTFLHERGENTKI